MKMTARPTEDILREKGWTKSADGRWNHVRTQVLGASEADALDVQRVRDERDRPAPRPTCGTCPYFVSASDIEGLCHHDTPRIVDFRNNQCDPYYGKYPFVGAGSPGCGQHPDMPAWIRDEWPKVRAQK